MITNERIITFPVLFEPKPNLSGDLKFGCSILVPKSDKEGVAKLKAEITKATSKGESKLRASRVPKFRFEALRDGW